MVKYNPKKKAQASGHWTRALRKAPKRSLRGLASPHSHNGNGKARAELSTSDRRKRKRRIGAAALERIRTKEQWLREELRENRKLMLGIFRFGLAVLIAFSTALYYIRRDVVNNLGLHHALPPNGTVPPMRYFVGTAILAVIAFLVCAMNRYLVNRQVGYRRQLIAMKPSYSGIEESPTGGKINRYHYWVFFAFPFIDTVLFFYFRSTSTVTIPW